MSLPLFSHKTLLTTFLFQKLGMFESFCELVTEEELNHLDGYLNLL